MQNFVGTSPSRLLGRFRTKGGMRFWSHLAPKWLPEGRQWDPLGVENDTKKRKMSVKTPTSNSPQGRLRPIGRVEPRRDVWFVCMHFILGWISLGCFLAHYPFAIFFVFIPDKIL